MSLSSDVNTYFDTIITNVDPTYKKWNGRFERSNIPRNINAKAYYIEIGELTSESPSDNFLDDKLEVNVYLFHKARKNVGSARNAAIDSAQDIRVEAQKPGNALIGANIKNVILDDFEPEEIDNDDNSIVLTMNFTLHLIYNF